MGPQAMITHTVRIVKNGQTFFAKNSDGTEYRFPHEYSLAEAVKQVSGCCDLELNDSSSFMYDESTQTLKQLDEEGYGIEEDVVLEVLKKVSAAA